MNDKNQFKSWWSGDKRVEPYMPNVAEAISRHVDHDDNGWQDIYNRAYEAVYKAIKDRSGDAKRELARAYRLVAADMETVGGLRDISRYVKRQAIYYENELEADREKQA